MFKPMDYLLKYPSIMLSGPFAFRSLNFFSGFSTSFVVMLRIGIEVFADFLISGKDEVDENLRFIFAIVDYI